LLKQGRGRGTEKSQATHPPSRLLLVDDDPGLLLALAGTIESRLDHCAVDTCESGMRAMELVKAHPYDTIISDVMMPGMSGWQFLSAVKQCRADTPVFLMSGNAGPTARRQALEGGAISFFSKPFDRDEFVTTVQQGLQLFRLNRLSALENSVMRRGKSHHATLVEKLHQHDGAYAILDTNAVIPESPQPVDQSSQRRPQYRLALLQHMAILDQFLTNIANLHTGTLSRLRAVEASLHRHAFAQLQVN
jgi:CheY-like chemotaxis protein